MHCCHQSFCSLKSKICIRTIELQQLVSALLRFRLDSLLCVLNKIGIPSEIMSSKNVITLNKAVIASNDKIQISGKQMLESFLLNAVNSRNQQGNFWSTLDLQQSIKAHGSIQYNTICYK